MEDARLLRDEFEKGGKMFKKKASKEDVEAGRANKEGEQIVDQQKAIAFAEMKLKKKILDEQGERKIVAAGGRRIGAGGVATATDPALRAMQRIQALNEDRNKILEKIAGVLGKDGAAQPVEDESKGKYMKGVGYIK